MLTKSIQYITLVILSISCYANDGLIFFEGDPLKLKGQWTLVMEDFLNYQETSQNVNSVPIHVPSIWNDVIWNGEPVGAYGFGTYYKSFVYSKNLPDTTLAIEIPEISLSYRLYANDQLIGQVGRPGRNIEESIPKIDYQIFDFKVNSGDTVTFIFHISNFENKAGGLWYEPTVDFESRINKNASLSKSIKLLILGCILLAGLFQLSTYILRPSEKFSIYFFLVCTSLILLMITRGDMTMLDLFPDTSWVVLKKSMYLGIVMAGASNAFFLRELYFKYFNKRVIDIIGLLAVLLSIFVLAVSPRISYNIIPYLHAYNILIGIYFFICLIRAVKDGKFGARFIMLGYIAVFTALSHDMLSSLYIIPSYSFQLSYFGITMYVILLMLVLTRRYLFALNARESLSNHLKKVNKELEEMVDRRTKALQDKNQIIESKNAELEQAIKEKDHLMAVVAHDLKAPLSSIQGLSEIIGVDLEGQSAEFNEMIKKVTIDGRAMIENLTQLKVFEQEDYEVQSDPVRISDFFKQKQVEFKPRADKKGIQFETKLEALRTTINTDVNVLGRIVDNLLSNAIKFTPKGGFVHFSLQLNDDHMKLSVKDNGPGFKEKDKSKVFQKFQRLSARPTGGESSTGLGLSIVKTLVNLLNGDIQLESQEGNGATFTVTIPVN